MLFVADVAALAGAAYLRSAASNDVDVLEKVTDHGMSMPLIGLILLHHVE